VFLQHWHWPASTGFPPTTTISAANTRADFDRLHRLVPLGRLAPRKIVDIGVSLTMNAAGPYTEVLGVDIYNNARGRARSPGVARNTLRSGNPRVAARGS
jgi:hypothetical protein